MWFLVLETGRQRATRQRPSVCEERRERRSCVSRAVACDPRPSPNSDDSGTKPQSASSVTSGRRAPAVGRDGARGRRRRSPLTCRRRRAAGSCPGPGCHSFPVLSTRSRTPGAQAQCARVTRGHCGARAPRGAVPGVWGTRPTTPVAAPGPQTHRHVAVWGAGSRRSPWQDGVHAVCPPGVRGTKSSSKVQQKSSPPLQKHPRMSRHPRAAREAP